MPVENRRFHSATANNQDVEGASRQTPIYRDGDCRPDDYDPFWDRMNDQPADILRGAVALRMAHLFGRNS